MRHGHLVCGIVGLAASVATAEPFKSGSWINKR